PYDRSLGDQVSNTFGAFAENVFLIRSRFDPGIAAYALDLAGRDVVELRDAGGEPCLALSIQLFCRIVRLPGTPRRWTTHTTKYLYRLEDPADPRRRIVACHWHPDVEGITFPHIHPLVASPEAQRLHYTIPHATLKDVLTFAMRDYGVRPIRTDWQAAHRAADETPQASLRSTAGLSSP
ncbi:MAG: hypothetical protein ACRDJN_13110, partial [Chloroflexota bacterium]